MTSLKVDVGPSFEFAPSTTAFPVGVVPDDLAALEKAWKAYRRVYLTQVAREEAKQIYEAALLAGIQNIDQIYEAWDPISPTISYSHEAIVHVTFAAEGPRFLANRLWAAGYVFERPHLKMRVSFGEAPDDFTVEMLSKRPSAREVLVWKVKEGAPPPPMSPFEHVRPVPDAGIELGSYPFQFQQGAQGPEAASVYPEHLRRMFSASPFIVIDRASRDGQNWQYNPEEEIVPYFEDGRIPGLRLVYGDPKPSFDVETAAQNAIGQLQELDDRTADVWRVILWKAAEAGISQGNAYARIDIDTREVAQLLGYQAATRGGMKKQDLRHVHKALEHLERMQLFVSPDAKGTLEVDTGQGKGKRKAKQLVKARQERVISVMSREVERDLLGDKCHMVWGIALGDWAKFFPRSFSPMFKALVELPNRGGKFKWAKRIGTELALLYRQDAQGGEKVKKLKWSTILDRAGLMAEVADLRQGTNRSRIAKQAEEAMDLLQKKGVVKAWHMRSQDQDRVNSSAGKPGSITTWLDSIVEITVPDEVMEILETIERPKPRRTSAKK